MERILVIQTAFIGDVILATAVVEKLHQHYPDARLDFLLRKGNEDLLANHPFIAEVIIWDKKSKKYDNLKQITKGVKNAQYDLVVNLQRFASSGLITALSGASMKVGFKKNPLSFSFTKKIEHRIGDGTHEVDRNQKLIEEFTDSIAAQPKLYPTNNDYEKVEPLKNETYVCIAPTSVWFTKQLPAEQWVKVIQKLDDKVKVYLLGGPNDREACETILKLAGRKNVVNLCGELSFLESAALMQTASMNHVNDSAPLHIASATNAPVTAYFCSTVPDFGFTPLSTVSKIVQVSESESLACRPCGLHGKKECPEGHFDCGLKIAL